MSMEDPFKGLKHLSSIHRAVHPHLQRRFAGGDAHPACGAAKAGLALIALIVLGVRFATGFALFTAPLACWAWARTWYHAQNVAATLWGRTVAPATATAVRRIGFAVLAAGGWAAFWAGSVHPPQLPMIMALAIGTVGAVGIAALFRWYHRRHRDGTGMRPPGASAGELRLH